MPSKQIKAPKILRTRFFVIEERFKLKTVIIKVSPKGFLEPKTPGFGAIFETRKWVFSCKTPKFKAFAKT